MLLKPLPGTFWGLVSLLASRCLVPQRWGTNSESNTEFCKEKWLLLELTAFPITPHLAVLGARSVVVAAGSHGAGGVAESYNLIFRQRDWLPWALKPRSLPHRHTSSSKATPPAPSQTVDHLGTKLANICLWGTFSFKLPHIYSSVHQNNLVIPKKPIFYSEFYSNNILLFRLRIKNDRFLAYKLQW